MISYGMPLYKHRDTSPPFRLQAPHRLLRHDKRLMAAYKEEFEPYKKAIATVQFPMADHPVALVRKVVKAR